MPATSLRMAVSITVAPLSASIVRRVPLESIKVIFGMMDGSQSRTLGNDVKSKTPEPALRASYIVIRGNAPVRRNTHVLGVAQQQRDQSARFLDLGGEPVDSRADVAGRTGGCLPDRIFDRLRGVRDRPRANA